MTAPGYISAHELYRLGEAKRRLGMGRHSFRALRQAGLTVLKSGRNCYIDGAHLIDVMKCVAERQRGGQGGGGDGL